MTARVAALVVGVGPAGARAAELLAGQGADVVMLDPKAPWEKPCGGGLPPPSFDDFPQLEELDPVSRRIDRVRIELGSGDCLAVELRRPIRIISRRTLARWQLHRALEAGAVHRRCRVRSASRESGAWRVEADGETFFASLLVGADGAASVVRRTAAPEFRIELAPARVAYPELQAAEPDLLVLRFYDGVAGYLWDFPRPDHRSVGIEVAAGSGLRRGDLDLEVDDYRASCGSEARAEVLRAGAVIGTAQLGHGDFAAVGGADFALLGDAAGFADPLTGEGIHNALRSASLLAEAWASGDVRSYPERARQAFGREFATARFLRRTLLESGRGVALLRRAGASKLAYVTVANILNALNEHDARLIPFAGRWAYTLRRVWASVDVRTPDTRGGPSRDHGPVSTPTTAARRTNGRADVA